MGPGCWLRCLRNRRRVRRLRAYSEEAKPLLRRKAQRGCLPRGSRVKVYCRRPLACSLEETRTSLAAYSRWMREQRSVTESPLDLRWRILEDLVDALGDDRAGYAAVAVRDVCSRERRSMAPAAPRRSLAPRARSWACRPRSTSGSGRRELRNSSGRRDPTEELLDMMNAAPSVLTTGRSPTV